ncbi:hypothetical protein J6590_096295 [Homalodisca vitripennis]|nr:hypothetical protein J6590_096295 [Homalodisca vitripennis]
MAFLMTVSLFVMNGMTNSKSSSNFKLVIRINLEYSVTSSSTSSLNSVLEAPSSSRLFIHFLIHKPSVNGISTLIHSAGDSRLADISSWKISLVRDVLRRVLNIGVKELCEQVLKRKKRRWWVRSWILRRSDLGAPARLFKELELEDPSSYANILRKGSHWLAGASEEITRLKAVRLGCLAAATNQPLDNITEMAMQNEDYDFPPEDTEDVLLDEPPAITSVKTEGWLGHMSATCRATKRQHITMVAYTWRRAAEPAASCVARLKDNI